MLEWAHCQKCKKSLLRAELEGASQVEIKCERCGALNLFRAPQHSLVPDGQGGYALTPLPGTATLRMVPVVAGERTDEQVAFSPPGADRATSKPLAS